MATEYSVEYIYKQIITREYKWCKVLLNGQTKLILSTANYTQLTPEEIVTELKAYFADFPNSYRILLKKKPTDKDHNIMTYDRVNVNDYTVNNADSSLQQGNNLGTTEIKKLRESIKKELLAELVANKKKDDLAKLIIEQKRKSSELDTVAGKLTYLLTAVLQGTALKGVMGNTNTTTNSNIQNMAHEPKDLNAFTQTDKDKANEALMRLLSVTNPEFLLEMATTLQKKPELLVTLKSFI